MSKTTPGPWKWETNECGGNYIAAGPAGSVVVANIDDPYCCVEIVNRADARLIAAAPELLELVRNIANDTVTHYARFDFTGKTPPAFQTMRERALDLIKRIEEGI